MDRWSIPRSLRDNFINTFEMFPHVNWHVHPPLATCTLITIQLSWLIEKLYCLLMHILHLPGFVLYEYLQLKELLYWHLNWKEMSVSDNFLQQIFGTGIFLSEINVWGFLEKSVGLYLIDSQKSCKKVDVSLLIRLGSRDYHYHKLTPFFFLSLWGY